MTRARPAGPRWTRCLSLATSVTESLEQQVAHAGTDREICGLLGGARRADGTVLATAARPLRNRAVRRREFEISIADLRLGQQALLEAGLQPLALYHSHPSGSVRPSFRDLLLPEVLELPLLILGRQGQRMHAACYGLRGESVVPVAVKAQRRRRAVKVSCR